MIIKRNKKPKKIFVLYGDPNIKSSTSMILNSYLDGIKKTGLHTVRVTKLSEMDFNPVLEFGYNKIQELEQDLVKFQDDIKWADTLVFMYPNWWCAMPAKMKGIFDRSFLPGFAFRFKKDSTGNRTTTLVPMLKGKAAHIFIWCGSYSPSETKRKMGDYSNELARGILNFSGVSPVRVDSFGPSSAPDSKKEKWCKKIKKFGSFGI